MTEKEQPNVEMDEGNGAMERAVTERMEGMRTRKPRWLAIALFLLLALSGTSSTADTGARLLDAVVVTAEREAQPFRTGDVDTEETPGSVTVIPRDRFEGKITDLAEVLEKEAGIQVRRSGGLGGYAEVSLRGSSSEQVMVFLDGVPLNDASGGGVDLGTISLSDVAAVEIYRGVTPVQFGKASMGGVVNIRTLRAVDGLTAKASVGYGSFDTRRASALVQYKPEAETGRWDVLAAAEHLELDNDFPFLNDKGTAYNPNDDEEEDRRNAGSRQENLLARAGYDVTERLRTEIFHQYFRKDQQIPDWRNTAATGTSLDMQRHVTGLNVTADDLAGTGLNTAARISWTWKREEYDDREGRVGLGTQHDRDDTRRLDIHLFAEWLTDAHSLGVMANFQRETYDPEDLLNHKERRDSQRQGVDLAVQDAWRPWGDAFVVTPALRYGHVWDERASGVSAYGSSLDGSRVDSGHFSPQIGLIYRPESWLTLKTNLARYVREPSFSELFGDRGLFTGNPDLEAETGANFDLGFDATFDIGGPSGPDSGFRWVRRLSVGATFFHNTVDDLIARAYDARGVGKAVNVAEAEITGLEASLALDFLEILRLSTNATWQDTQNRNPVAAFDGKALPGRWAASWTTRLEALVRGVRIWGEFESRRDMYYDTANLLPAEDRELVNLGLSWTFDTRTFSAVTGEASSTSWTLDLEARNIADRQYEDFNGYPMPGAAYYVTLTCGL